MTIVLDLFSAPRLHGLASGPDFLSSQEEAELIMRIDDAERMAAHARPKASVGAVFDR